MFQTFGDKIEQRSEYPVVFLTPVSTMSASNGSSKPPSPYIGCGPGIIRYRNANRKLINRFTLEVNYFGNGPKTNRLIQCLGNCRRRINKAGHRRHAQYLVIGRYLDVQKIISKICFNFFPILGLSSVYNIRNFILHVILTVWL